MKTIGIGLIGSGFMGHTHATAYINVENVFGSDIVPRLEIVADSDPEKAKELCRMFGFKRWTTDWKEVVKDPNVDLVDITTPNSLHCPIAVEAAKNGKNILCEKPLAVNAEEAKETTEIIKKADVITAVGFNYIQNPVQEYVKSVIDSGELGEVVNFRGTYDQDYYAEDDTLHEWRFLKEVSASGALGDLATHTISLSQYLVGDIQEVNGMTQIVVDERPDPNDTTKMLPVENDDVVQFMFRYKNGATGNIVSNRLACGRKMSLTYEIQLTRGGILYTQERQNEVQIYRHDDRPLERGFKTVQIAPGHGEFEHFFSGAAIGLGYADLKTIEVYKALRSVANKEKNPIDFEFACKNNVIIDAVLESAETGQWISVE